MAEAAVIETAMIDSHCHLDSFPKNELDSTLAEAKKQGIRAIISSGFDLESSFRNVEIASANRGFIFATIGLAPQRAQDSADLGISGFESMLNEKSVIAVGEIGLDFKRGAAGEQRKRQENAFRAFLSLARERSLRAVVHSRLAEGRVLSVLREEKAGGVLMHCFSGSREEARECVDRGYYISVPPMKSDSRKKMLKAVPIESLVTESDAPYIGRKPIDIIKSAQIIADVVGIELVEVLKRTTSNAERFFSIHGVEHGC